ncbi:hypothetical protein [Salaquimonas pukyongi]|uniref:hypothetical protein n=1 Tax=Salaquimonas pukyongi TaxID=2712698 RepID=UPI0013BE9200|nr:hypothetical protein [Salaquimonas pukyongi]
MAKLKSIRAGVFGLLAMGATLGAATQAAAEEVYVLRGAFDVFSAGMNQMTKRMQARGINARAYSNGAWRGLADNIIKRDRQGGVSYPIVIMGHSVGGQEAAAMSNYLGQNGIRVSLVVGFDPGFAQPQPFRYGSPRVVNFYIAGQPRGHPYRSAAGFGGSINNINIKSFTNADHVAIDKDPKVQSRALSVVYAAVGK